MNGRACLLLGCWLAVGSSGCDSALPEPPKPSPTPLGEAFDAATTGTITGQVLWDGELPRVSCFRAPICAAGDAAGGARRDWPNPNAPVIDPTCRGVAGAVLFLRNVDLHKSQPWDQPPVCVEMAEYQLRIRQGNFAGRTGFARRGAAVELVSRQPVFHALRSRGAAFFTLPFPDAEQPRQHIFDQPGVIELSSGATYFWARAYLFIADHPYFARTDADGRFTLPEVPPGDYELVCWHPNWHEQERELDADSWQVSRLTFREPVEVQQTVIVRPGGTLAVKFTLSAKDFDR